MLPDRPLHSGTMMEMDQPGIVYLNAFVPTVESVPAATGLGGAFFAQDSVRCVSPPGSLMTASNGPI